jgi:hypothetical protein
MITYFGTVILWMVYSSIFGYCDAWYWYSANVAKYCDKNFQFKDLHPHYFWTRSLVGSVFALTMAKDNLWLWFPIIICLSMMLPFFHNGFYYKTRNQIDPNIYKLGFRDMTTTSIAPINFTFLLRTILFLVGLLGIFLIYFL